MDSSPTLVTQTLPTAPVSTELTSAANILNKIGKALGVEIPASDITTLINLVTPLMRAGSSSSSSSSAIPEKKCKPMDDGECLDETGVLDLISRVKKGVIERDDALATLKTELKRQYRKQALVQKDLDDLWSQINAEKDAISRAVERMNEYRDKTPVNDDARFDQYLSDLRTVTQLRKSVQQKEFRAHKDSSKMEPSPSISRLEEALVSLL